MKPYRLAERKGTSTHIAIRKKVFGADKIILIAGPCAIESKEQAEECVDILKAAGIGIMRASIFKPRTSPYDFQGLGEEGVGILDHLRKTLIVETEVLDTRQVKMLSEHADILRVGARNMQNFPLLKELGKIKTPIILKRGMGSTIKEFILAAEYILHHGNPNVILCERGIRTFEPSYKNTLDLAAISILKKQTHLPVIADPSHAAGDRELVPSLAKAAVAAGADGLMIEMHPDPAHALSDGPQSMLPEDLKRLVKELRPIAKAVGRAI